jgi:hypothetical protein
MRVEWRAVVFGGLATLIAGFGIPLVFLAAVALVPSAPLARAFVWFSDDTVGRTVSSLLIAGVGWAVGYRVASQRKALHGCLGPIAYLAAFWLLAAAVAAFSRLG